MVRRFHPIGDDSMIIEVVSHMEIYRVLRHAVPEDRKRTDSYTLPDLEQCVKLGTWVEMAAPLAAEPGARFFVRRHEEFVGRVLYLRYQAGKVKQVCKDGTEASDEDMTLEYILGLVATGHWEEVSLEVIHGMRNLNGLTIPEHVRYELNKGDIPATVADAW